MSLSDTIAALASASGPALRSVIRISGTETLSIVQRVCDCNEIDFSIKRARTEAVTFSLSGTHLPIQLMLWPTNRSFTGEPVAELHLVGSMPIVNRVLSSIWSHGARPAERGEFTLRAFLAGRIDLTQAEAVLGVIDAGNANELETALDQLAGGISGPIAELHETLLLHLADLEAGLDFVEEDIEFVDRSELQRRLQNALEMVNSLLLQSQQRMTSSARPRVVLAGLPNAGKSTLFNHFTGDESALVSEVAGTTRDYLQASISINGIDIELIDTAGWETARDGIEQLASELRSEQYDRSQLVVWCSSTDFDEADINENGTRLDQLRSSSRSILEVVTKADLLEESSPSDAIVSTIHISATNGVGIEQLREAIVQHLSNDAHTGDLIGTTAARCRESLENARVAILQSLTMVQQHAGDELIAMELRDILDHLGRIVGKVYTDDILDRIFSRFCIGK